MSGHAIFCGPPTRGLTRRNAIVIHRDYRACLSSPPVFSDSAVAIAFLSSVLGPLWLISSHLEPSDSKSRFFSDVDQL
eukprot:6065581-Pyramimonas_sp.AAC.1